MENQNGYISVQNLRKIYKRKNQEDLLVFEDISFDVNKGEFLCIVGESGCGKSTLLRLISGLDTEYDGQIMVDQKPVKNPDKKRGFVYQENRLFPWMTVEKNVGFVINDGNKNENQKKIKEILKVVGLKGFETAYPKELSGGMAQRVNIARALVNKPDVLFFDEPFGALDALTRIQLQRELLMIHRKQQATTLLVTHDIEEAIFLANKIIVLKNRPAKIMDFIEVKLPYIRDRGSEDFQIIRKSIYKYFQED